MLPDVQTKEPEVLIPLTRVGVTDVKKFLEIKSDEKSIILLPSFDISVDLPANVKGANLSRDLEAINDVLEDEIKRPFYEIEELCTIVAKKLLEKHEYASRAEVQMRAEYIVNRITPVTEKKCQKPVDIFGVSRINRSGEIRKTVGAEVVGVTACPCTREIMIERTKNNLKPFMDDNQIKSFLSKVPATTHNQRSRGLISIETDGNFKVSIDKLITIIESSMSSNTFELLKRPDEAEVVREACQNPKFTEDCVRDMARRIVEDFKDMPDQSTVRIRLISEESIHQHNTFAERHTYFGDLREELGGI